MTPAARIQAVIDILQEIISQPRPADTLTSAYFRNRRYICSKDRQAINTRLYRIMREYFRLSWWIGRAGCPVDARSLAIAAVVLDKEHSARSLESAFNAEDKYAPMPLSAAELELARSLEGQKLDHPDMSLQARTECPDWAYESLQRALGDRFETEMKAMLSPAPLDLRVNILKATREQVLQELQEDGFDAHAGKISPWSIRVFGRPQISQHPVFKGGYVEIQDEGSQMVAVVANAQPGEQVVDFCAGAGGKTLAMAATMKNKGRLIAMDVLGGRLLRAKERFRRADVHNIETRQLTSERDKYVKRHQGRFDLVLVDAPCSGTGTWRRDPDKRWRQLGPGLETLLPLQRSILDSAYRMVKPGGRLVYATCSLLPDENEEQIDAFLKEHPQFRRRGADLSMSPARHDTDGFYAAVLRHEGTA
jgi:16S rRNA (cytosine967-C5)-methyltransferase